MAKRQSKKGSPVSAKNATRPTIALVSDKDWDFWVKAFIDIDYPMLDKNTDVCGSVIVKTEFCPKGTFIVYGKHPPMYMDIKTMDYYNE